MIFTQEDAEKRKPENNKEAAHEIYKRTTD